MDTCVCMAESLHCSPEAITTLLIGCTQIQNDLLFLKKKKKKNQIMTLNNVRKILEDFFNRTKLCQSCFNTSFFPKIQ